MNAIQRQFTCVGDICWSHDALDLVHVLQVWAQATMAAKNLLINNGCDGQAIKAVSECLPQFDVVASFAWET